MEFNRETLREYINILDDNSYKILLLACKAEKLTVSGFSNIEKVPKEQLMSKIKINSKIAKFIYEYSQREVEFNNDGGNKEVVSRNDDKSIQNIDIDEKKGITYLGYVERKNNFINFYPKYKYDNGILEPILDADVLFPSRGNVNIFGRKKDDFIPYNIYALTFSQDDLEELYTRSGELNITNFKLNADELFANDCVKNIVDLDLYYVVTLEEKNSVEDVNFHEQLSVKERELPIDNNAVLELDGSLYGPCKIVSSDEYETKIKFNVEKNASIIDTYKSKFGNLKSKYLDFEFEYENRKVYLVDVENNFSKDKYDIQSDEELINDFIDLVPENNINYNRKESLKKFISSMDVSKLSNSVIASRCKRIEKILSSEEILDDFYTKFASMFSKILVSKGDSEEFSDLMRIILDNQELSKKIQSFSIAMEKKNDIEKSVLEAEEKLRDINKQIDEKKIELDNVAESEKYNELEEKYKELKENVGSMDKVKARIEVYKENVDELRNKEIELKDRIKKMENSLTTLIKEQTDKLMNPDMQAENAIGVAFEGMIADRMFEVAAKWDREYNDNVYENIAEQIKENAIGEKKDNKTVISGLIQFVQKYRPEYSKNDIINLLICIHHNFLTVISGEPGTGKTSICNILANALGLSKEANQVINKNVNTSRFVDISVERGWTSKRDFIGYYNPLSKKIEVNNKRLYDGLCILDKEGKESPYPFLILLDEANLSSMEYYWADFMNLCDDHFGNNYISLGGNIHLQIPHTLRFMATINNDHTTEALSPRLIDRSFIVELPKCKYSNEALLSYECNDISYTWREIDSVFRCDDETLTYSTWIQTIYQDVVKKLLELGIIISPRVEKAMLTYWKTARNLFEADQSGTDADVIALDYAISQRLLPKINGNGDIFGEKLIDLEKIFIKNNLTKSEKIVKRIIKNGALNMKYYQYF